MYAPFSFSTLLLLFLFFFFFNDTATTEIYTLSLHDALPISFFIELGASPWKELLALIVGGLLAAPLGGWAVKHIPARVLMVAVGCLVIALRSEEHTSELQSRSDLVCRLLLEKKKQNKA